LFGNVGLQRRNRQPSLLQGHIGQTGFGQQPSDLFQSFVKLRAALFQVLVAGEELLGGLLGAAV